MGEDTCQRWHCDLNKFVNRASIQADTSKWSTGQTHTKIDGQTDTLTDRNIHTHTGIHKGSETRGHAQHTDTETAIKISLTSPTGGEISKTVEHVVYLFVFA